ncbi:ABC transporter six-transmembrane domain-containing protein [Nitratireductor sp. XY-223]|uniref:ABC transporter six-transmembrane domain-containing protein n=1 Tax=Nitratireductor sp. XY-223 TaxID=2561926 RepID=UPI0010AAF544|nr:ABC transporter six-transmembrane domain-containing protein [Nitratireductor sp. XY-223]
MLKDQPLTVGTLIRKFLRPISLTWLLTLCETSLTALIPLFMGFAIDGLLKGDTDPLIRLAAVLAGLIAIGVTRRVYDTRAYGTIRVALGTELIGRSGGMPVSRQNARLGMGRELVDFLETEVPAVMNSVVQLVISLVILFTFHPFLSYAAMASATLMIAIYFAFHGRFFRLNGEHNQQTEQQVRILEQRAPSAILSHLDRLRRIEIRLSDTEAYVYGAIFLVLLAFIVFNLWFAATNLATSVGTIFSIISYSWEFVESALVLPVTLQGWSRLTEIMQRINAPQKAA